MSHQSNVQTQPGRQQPGYNMVPIVQQPLSHGASDAGWMPVPQGLSNCPPGLKYLSTIDQLLVHQKTELFEVFSGIETNNKYTVKNNVGQKVYYAAEDNDYCTRNCCGPCMRSFEMIIMNNSCTEVIHLSCADCMNMEVSSPPGTVIATVNRERSVNFLVKDASGQVVLKIKIPRFTTSMFGDVKFNIYPAIGETKVGKITKQWSGVSREFFTDADNFCITFPMDLDVKIKAALLGACFFIDFMFFEKSAGR